MKISGLVVSLCLFIVIATMLSASCEVTPLRILKQHKITVATNGETEKLARSFLGWNFAPVKTISLSELLAQRDNLKTDGDVLFMVDRSKPISDAEAAILPIPLSAVEPDEILTAVVKKSIGNKKNYKNGWLIYVVAPNQTWLDKEMGLIPTVLNQRVSEQPGVVTSLHLYRVLMLDVISSAREDTLDRWVSAQLDTKRQAIDPDYCSIDSWEGTVDEERGLMFVLDRQKTHKYKEKVCSVVPENVKDWLNDNTNAAEGMAFKGEVEAKGKKIKTYTIVAPSERLVSRMLKKYPAIDSIPSTADKIPFTDLSDFGQMAVMVRFSDKSIKDNGVLHDFSNKILSQLSSTATGFECKSYQDLKELQLDQLLGDSPERISKADITKISRKLKNAKALMVLSLATISKRTDYEAIQPTLITQRYPPFPESKPSKPSKPSLSARKYGIAGPKLYAGADDPHYIDDMNKYYREKRQYEYDIYDWQILYDSYESKRDRHQMEWHVAIDQIESVAISGNLTIYDTRNSSEVAGTVAFSAPVTGSALKRTNYRDIRMQVIGEDRRPNAPDIPDTRETVSDTTLISSAFQDAAVDAIQNIVDSSVLPTDIAKN